MKHTNVFLFVHLKVAEEIFKVIISRIVEMDAVVDNSEKFAAVNLHIFYLIKTYTNPYSVKHFIIDVDDI